jgi:crossover junction endodeoxyribonuclease RusA
LRHQLNLTVQGLPIPQGSTRMLRNKKGEPYITHANPKLAEWRKAIVRELKDGGVFPFVGAVHAYMVFVLPRPKSVKRNRPCVKPDLDKLVRAVFDACEVAGVLGNDSQVTKLKASKHYQSCEADNPRLKLYLEELD